MSLQYGILGLLTYAPMNGYQLKTLFGKSIKHIWTASLSQIYRDLKSLEEKGFVATHRVLQDDRPDKKMYTLTPLGRRKFENWLKSPVKKAISPKRDDFMLRVFFGASLAKEDLLEHFNVFLSEIDKYNQITDEDLQNEHSDLIKELTHNLPSNIEKIEDREALYWKFTLRRVELTMQAIKQWAQECVDELEKLP